MENEMEKNSRSRTSTIPRRGRRYVQRGARLRRYVQRAGPTLDVGVCGLAPNPKREQLKDECSSTRPYRWAT